jgi:hypothetical protein
MVNFMDLEEYILFKVGISLLDNGKMVWKMDMENILNMEKL